MTSLINANFESTEALIKLIRPYGRVLLVTSRSFQKSGFLHALQKKATNKNFELVYDVDPLPTISQIEAKFNRFRGRIKDFDVLIAIGGGSVIDSAKCCLFLLQEDLNEDFEIILNTKGVKKDLVSIPFFTIPTTAGTGSDVTSFATIWDEKSKVKKSLEHASLRPTSTIHDLNLLKTLNYENLLYPALDALSHAMDSLWNVHANKSSIANSLIAISLITPNIGKHPENMSNLGYANLLQGSYFAGLAIESTRTSLSHAISYPLTSYYGVPHGLAASFTIPKIVDLVLNKSTEPTEIHSAFLNAKRTILGLNLNEMISSYCSQQEILELTPLISSTNRLDNFKIKVSDLDLKSLVL